MAIAKHIVVTSENDGAVILDKTNGTYFRLNPIGLHVFTALSEGKNVKDIASELCLRYPEANGRVQADVRRIVADLRTAKLVKP